MLGCMYHAYSAFDALQASCRPVVPLNTYTGDLHILTPGCMVLPVPTPFVLQVAGRV
jgi:hypothetical protein